MEQNQTIREVELIFDDDTAQQPRSTAETPGGLGGHRLAGGRVPTKALLTTMGVTGIGGIIAANMGTAGFAGLTSTYAAATSGAPASASSIASSLLGPIGATALVLGSWFIMRRKGLHSQASALLVTMWSSLLISGVVSAFTIGATPFLVSAIAFAAAATTAATALLGRSGRGVIGTSAAAALTAGVLVIGGLSGLLIASGGATVVGAIGSAVVGVCGALLGVKAWNRWWAPVVEYRERVSSYVNAMFAATSASVY
ncbi:hypothetical protein [Schaalia vaccimaxillae]|uniref:hypothetical protein n=1 Tax=Schaalia vaccimaxillae TaxID=183916 RepID=UPI0003B418E1|nr:hypothetical protein [Schaalia vaccimaxillae]